MIARAEAGADCAGIGAFDLGEAVESVAELYEPVAEENGATLKIEAARGLMVVGNRELIGQAVANLIDNAVKHGAPQGRGGGRRRKSRSSRGATARRWRSRSPTTAPASPPTTAPARSNVSCGWKARARGPGSGLGLSLAAAVMRMHGGALRLDDNDARTQGDRDPAGGDGSGAPARPAGGGVSGAPARPQEAA